MTTTHEFDEVVVELHSDGRVTRWTWKATDNNPLGVDMNLRRLGGPFAALDLKVAGPFGDTEA